MLLSILARFSGHLKFLIFHITLHFKKKYAGHMPIRFYYTGKAKETSSHPQSSFMFHFHLLTLKIQKFTICSLDF